MPSMIESEDETTQNATDEQIYLRRNWNILEQTRVKELEAS